MTSQDSSDTKHLLENTPILESKQKVLLPKNERPCVLALDSSTQRASIALSINRELVFSEDCFRQKSHSEWINGAIERAMTSINGNWTQLDLVALIHGPGSFTGLRVATNVAKALSFIHGIPLVTFNSLEVLATQALTHSYSLSRAFVPTPYHAQPHSASNSDFYSDYQIILSVINAFKNKIFGALFRVYEGELETLTVPQVVDIESLEIWVKQQSQNLTDLPSERGLVQRVLVVGDGFHAYPEHFNAKLNHFYLRSEDALDYPIASTLVQIVNKKWNELKPISWRELNPIYLRASAAEEARNSSSVV